MLFLNVQFNIEATTPKTKALYDGLVDLQEVVINHAYENRIQWGLFGNQTEAERATLDDIREKFTLIVRPPKAGSTFPPTCKTSFKLYYDKNTKKPRITTECFDSDNNEIDPSKETIPPRSECIPIIRATNIWISPQGRFGLKMQIDRIKVYAPDPGSKVGWGGDEVDTSGAGKMMITGQCLLDSDSED